MFEILKGLGKDTVTWDSTFETGMTMPKNAVVHDYEGGNASVAKIAKAGVKVSLCLSLLLSLSLCLNALCCAGHRIQPRRNVCGRAGAVDTDLHRRDHAEVRLTSTSPLPLIFSYKSEKSLCGTVG
jgi:hypothetical protein